MTSIQLSALSPIMALATAIIVVMLVIAAKRNYSLTVALSVTGILLTLLSVVSVWPNAPVQTTLLLRIDRYALMFMGLLLLAGLAVMGFCYDYFKGDEGENEELFLLLLTALFGASILVCSDHFASFFLGLEILSISLFVLVGYPLTDNKPLEAAIKYLVLSGVSSALLLMGMALIYADTGKLFFGDIGPLLAGHHADTRIILAGAIFILAAIAFKLSLVPFHLWTPDVYEGAPAPITAFIATVLKGSVMALLLRLFLASGNRLTEPLLAIFSIIAVITIMAGNLLALLQSNVKRLLAYSSIAHLGYLLVPFIAAANRISPLAWEAITFYLVAYVITTIGAFGVVSMLSSSGQEACGFQSYQGLFWRRRWLAAFFTLTLLSLAGIPLTVGFIGKFYIFTSGADSRLWLLLAAVVLGSALSLYYYVRLIAAMAFNTEQMTVASEMPMANKNISLSILSTVSLTMLWLGINPDKLIGILQLAVDPLK